MQLVWELSQWSRITDRVVGLTLSRNLCSELSNCRQSLLPLASRWLAIPNHQMKAERFRDITWSNEKHLTVADRSRWRNTNVMMCKTRKKRGRLNNWHQSLKVWEYDRWRGKEMSERRRDRFNYNRERVVEGARQRGRELLGCGFELQENEIEWWLVICGAVYVCVWDPHLSDDTVCDVTGSHTHTDTLRATVYDCTYF